MRSALLILTLLVISVFITGCSNGSNDTLKTEQSNTSITEGLDEQPINPDIGTLDDIPVSYELPQ